MPSRPNPERNEPTKAGFRLTACPDDGRECAPVFDFIRERASCASHDGGADT